MSQVSTRSLPLIRLARGTLRFELDAAESRRCGEWLRRWGEYPGERSKELTSPGPSDADRAALDWICCEMPTLAAWIVAACHQSGNDHLVSRGLSIEGLREALASAGALASAAPVNGVTRCRPRERLALAFARLNELAAVDAEVARRRGLASLLLALLGARRPYWVADAGPPALPDWLPRGLCRALRWLRTDAAGEVAASASAAASSATCAMTSVSDESEIELPVLELVRSVWRAGQEAEVRDADGESWGQACVTHEPEDGDWAGWWQAVRWRCSWESRLRTEKLESLRQLAYGASHEINNPLANISTRAQTLLRDETDPERRHKLAAIAAQAFRAHEMIANLMLFARPPAVRMEEFEFASWWQERQSELLPDARGQGTELRFQSAGMPERLQSDPAALAIVLSALVRNSREALGRGGEIVVACVPRGLGWVMRVSDTGLGLDATAARHLFDPFFSGREAGRGLGFGLSKAWVICRSLGGQLDWVASGEGWTCFEAWLPKGS